MLAYYLYWTFTNFVLLKSAEIVTRNPDAPEPKPKLTTPEPKSDQWRNFKDGAKHTALLFAGKNEFDWIVDIRVEDLDQEFWATGNLITHKKVLTTCRATKLILKRAALNNLRLNFATQYLWETHVRNAKKGDSFDALGISGNRMIHQTNPHPNCNLEKSVLWDTSIIQLKEAVIPYLPGVGFVFFPTVVKHKVEGKLCYVGTFGKKYVNWGEKRLLDHKVKYRVYDVDWKSCFSDMKYMFDQTMDEPTYKETYSKQDAKNLSCYETRAKVGSVCDHDRGAPVICNNDFIGLVSRGANFHHCNNLLHVRFFVLKREAFTEYFGDVFDTSKSEDTRSSCDHLAVESSLLTYMIFSCFLMYIISVL